MKTKIVKLLTICILSFTLTSCWDAIELEELYLVYGVGIDIDKYTPDKYLITAIAPTVQTDAREKKIEITGEGTSLRNAQNSLQSKATKKITFTNTKIFVINEEVARKGINQHVDALLRDPEGRGSIQLVISKERAFDILKMNPISTPFVSLYLLDGLKRSNELSITPLTPIRKYSNEFYTDGIEVAIPYVELSTNRQELIINSTALFRKDKLIGLLHEKESFFFMLLRGVINGGYWSVPYGHNHDKEENIVTLRIINGKSKIKTEIIDGELHIHHHISFKTNLSESTGDESVFAAGVIEDIEKKVTQHVYEESSNVINLLQKEFKNDNIGYGRYVKVNHPDIFDAKEWNDMFSKAKIHIYPSVKLVRVGSEQ